MLTCFLTMDCRNRIAKLVLFPEISNCKREKEHDKGKKVEKICKRRKKNVYLQSRIKNFSQLFYMKFFNFHNASNMKRVLFAASLMVATSTAMAQNDNFEYGTFNHLSMGVSAGTEGFGIDVGTCLNKYLSLRAGVDIMPSFKINTDVDVEGTLANQSYSGTMEVEGSLSRTAINVKLDCFPFGDKSSFFVTAGASFGGDEIVKIKGHSEELKNLIAKGNDLAINIGEYQIPVDNNGDVAGGVKVSGFRPYVGVGFGRLVPKKRVAVRVEVGTQIHGTPKVYADGVGDLEKVLKDAGDDDISKLIDKLTFYPVLKVTLRGRIF